ncbi:MAG: hypothetical protein DMG27_13410, partial [Acidobacteria bacterium]
MRVLVPVGLCVGLIASAHSGANRAVHKQNKFPSETGYRLGAIRASKVSASASYGRPPLSFEANRGQTNDQVKFLARGRDYALFLSATEAVLSFKEPAAACGAGHATGQPAGDAESSAPVEMKLVGASPAPKVSGVERLPGIVNYFVGDDPKDWRTRVPTYARVRYDDVYPGIDLVYYGNRDHQLEYDFVVGPGADPKAIRLSLEGGGALKLDAHGDLVFEGTGREVRFHKPRLYQERGGKKQDVSGRYVLRGKHQVAFRVASYDASRPLMIDPTLSYSTYLGSANFDQGDGIAADAAGNAYVAGFTSGSAFKTTTGAYSTTYRGNTDAFVTKYSPSGSVVYSTYLGGSGTDQAVAIAVDATGDAYVTGQTLSSNFPTTAGAARTTYSGKGDAFVAKLSATGSSLVYSTYLGGSGPDQARGIALDALNNAYVTGQTFSTDFPTLSALQTANSGNQDAFVAELNSSGSLVYSTYLGGSGFDQANGIAVDSLGRAYVTGYTNSSNFPVANAPQAACKSCPNVNDAFVTEIGPDGSALVYSTYLGGSGDDHGLGIAVDALGNAYATGFTFSPDFPTTSGAYQRSLLGSVSAFVAKVSANGSSLGYSTYLGTSGSSYGQSIAVMAGIAYIAGVTNASSFPMVSPIQSTKAGNPDAFVAELNAAGSALYFSTFLGGSGFDEANAIAVDGLANAYITGHTTSTNFRLQSASQGSYGGGDSDAFVTKILFPTTVTVSPASLNFSNQAVGIASAPQSVTVTNVGAAPLGISSLTVSGTNSGDFAVVGCGSAVAPNGSCTVSVTFTPTATGTRSATLTITDNAAGSPQTVSLSGTGTTSAVTLSPSSLAFGNQQVTTTSPAQNVTLTNSGTAPLTISSISLTGANTGDFNQTNNCPLSPSTLAVNGTCTLTVTFTPTTTGARSASVSVTDNAAGSPQTVSLSGTGTTSAVTLSPSSLAFGNQQVTTTSPAQNATLTNSGTAPLTISSISLTGANTGDFNQTN